MPSGTLAGGRSRGMPGVPLRVRCDSADRAGCRALRGGYPTRMAGGSVSRLRRALIYFGLARPEDGVPRRGAARRSRYGVYVSPRLDEDVDELKKRLAALERR